MTRRTETKTQPLSPSLRNYVLEERMTQEQLSLLLRYIRKGGNIVVGGGTGSGKTHFLSAVLDETERRNPDQVILVFDKFGEYYRRFAGNFGLAFIPMWDEDVVEAITFARFTVQRWMFFDELYRDPEKGWEETVNWHKCPGRHAAAMHSMGIEETARRLERCLRYLSEKQLDKVKRRTLFIQVTRDVHIPGSLARIETAEWKAEESIWRK